MPFAVLVCARIQEVFPCDFVFGFPDYGQPQIPSGRIAGNDLVNALPGLADFIGELLNRNVSRCQIIFEFHVWHFNGIKIFCQVLFE